MRLRLTQVIAFIGLYESIHMMRQPQKLHFRMRCIDINECSHQKELCRSHCRTEWMDLNDFLAILAILLLEAVDRITKTPKYCNK